MLLPVADDVFQITSTPPHGFNAYIAGDTLFDGMTRWDTGRILRAVSEYPVARVAITHAHPDHQGAVDAVCRRHGIPLLCHELDAEALAGRAPLVAQNPFFEVVGNIIWAGRRRAADQTLRDGDMVGEFRVVHLPGHTAGHVAYFRQRDRLAIAGDLLCSNSHNPFRRRMGLRQPPWFFSLDPAENRRSIRKLFELQPKVLCLGHGKPVRDMELFERFVRSLNV